MRIGIIGAASMGGTLARRLVKLGHHVSIANSRGPESLIALAAETGATPVAGEYGATRHQPVIPAVSVRGDHDHRG